MAFKLPHSEEMLSDKNRFINEDEFKAEKLSVKIRPLKINSNIRDQSCIVTFPRGSYENRLTRSSVEEIMKIQWGDLYAHVKHFGNIDFSRKWIFHFDTQENCEIAVAKELFINKLRIKPTHATKKFNTLKIDRVPLYVDLNDLAAVLLGVPGISGKFVDIS